LSAITFAIAQFAAFHFGGSVIYCAEQPVSGIASI
jgi:hypothetical protein